MSSVVKVFVFLSTVYLGLTHAYSSSSRSSTCTRRGWFSTTCSSAAVAVPFWAVASAPVSAAVKTTTYSDPTHGFSIEVPSDWVRTEQKMSDRRDLILWSDPADKSSSFFIAYTPVRDDYTSLGSFGNVDQVAAQTILPKGELAGQKVKAEMLSATSAKQAYIFDYAQEIPDVQPATHFRTIFTLQQGATGGAGSVLVTLTAQCPEGKYAANKELFDAMISSYGKSV